MLAFNSEMDKLQKSENLNWPGRLGANMPELPERLVECSKVGLSLVLRQILK